MSRNATDKKLSPKQEKVMDALVSGESISQAAGIGKVDRGTVHRWLKDDFVFQAEYNRRRLRLKEEMQMRLVRLADNATSVVEKAVDEGDTKTAIVVLAKLGILGKLEPGSINPHHLQHDRFCDELSGLMKSRSLSDGT